MNDADILRLDWLGHSRRTLDEACRDEERGERDSEGLEHVASPLAWDRYSGATVYLVSDRNLREQRVRAMILQICRTPGCFHQG